MKQGRHQVRGRARSMLVLFVVAVVAALLLSGCQAEVPDDGPAPTTTAAGARRLAEKTLAAGQFAADTGRFELTVTDEEVTSFLNIGSLFLSQAQRLPIEDLTKLQEIPELEGVDIEQWRGLLEQRERLPGASGGRLRFRLILEEPAVHFRGTGDIVVRGNAKFLILELPVRIVAAPRASHGELVLDFVEGQLGAVPMPELLFDTLGKGLSSAILMGEDLAQITEISVGPGKLTVRGRYEG